MGLGAAEIDFAAFPADKPKIVGYAAKWDERAMELRAHHGNSTFPHSDSPSLDWLRNLALGLSATVWHLWILH